MKHKLVTSLFVAFAASACMAGELLPNKSFSIATRISSSILRTMR